MRMRIHGFAGVLLAGALLAPGPAAAGRGLRPGLELGVRSASASHPEGLTSFDSRWTTGVAAGFTLRAALPAKLALESGLRYVREADRVHDDVDLAFGGGVSTGWWEGTTTFQRLALPLRVSAGLPFGRGFSLEAGVEPQYLLRADQSTDSMLLFATSAGVRGPAAPAAIIFESLMGDHEVTSTLPRWSAVVSAGVGWEPLTTQPAVVLHARWLQGVSDQTLSPYMKRYSRAAELGLGLRW